MKVSEFIKLKLNQRLYDIEEDEFTTKRHVISLITQRAEKIARSGYPLSGEKNYVYGWLIERLEIADEQRVHKEVKVFLKKLRLDK